MGSARRGFPINPALREPPAEPVLTGISVIDALTTLVRGQKLSVFSVAGLPHLELAAQLAAQASVGGDPFCVVFAAMGLTHADAATVRAILQERSATGELVLLLNLADAPVIERILTPRVALTVAERLAFTLGRHVLVVMADMTSYCEALREVSAARGEIPARRAYPGYLYSDLASLYERCGRIRGMPGSVTVVPVLTMPAGDITHPVPDLTGYITEGQIVLSPDLHARGVYPPVDVSKLGFTVPPGRAGRLWLARRLQVARRGADLLDRKLRILTEELGRLRESAAQTAADWNRSCAEAERWLLRASVLGGQRAVRPGADGEVADVTISYTVSMGVRHPASTTCVIPAATSWDGPEALRVVEAEALATRYRLRAIRERWIPRLEQALAEVTLAIEEQELADAARLRLASGPGTGAEI